MNTSSNEIWIDCTNYNDFESTRPVLFRDDMREQFLKWLRIKPDHKVLVGGCGPGVEVRFIAKGLESGKVTGFDISKYFVEHGNKKIAEEGLSDKAEIVLDDGYNLSFANNTFDAIVNHQYIGVLSDPVAGLKELIRVCKIGGTVSVSASGRGGGGCDSDCAFENNERLKELTDRYMQTFWKIYTPKELKQSEYWHSQRYPKMFAEFGLKNITIHAYASAFSYSDSYWSDEFKTYKIKSGMGKEIKNIESNSEDLRFQEYGFSKQDFQELIKLNKTKQEYLLNNLNNNQDWEWSVSTNYIVAGEKS
ncbi:MAG: methyltransferase domain-containing protein [Oscillospiraceae bacterium]|nr:methyltransferase domain-containing protein [Oscillospiraceae bacterium]